MGDLNISNSLGSVTIDKVKGTNIVVDNPNGNILIKKVLEGGVYLNCQKLYAKMINGDTVNIKSSDFTNVEAIYGKETNISSDKKVDIGLFKGNIAVS